MSDPSGGRTKFLYLWKETISKVSQIILQTRVQFPLGTISGKRNKLFNLETEDCDLITSELLPWQQQFHRFLGIEVYAYRRGPHSNEKQRYILERWRLDFGKIPLDSTQRIELAKSYKALIVLIRSVFSRVRLMPSFELFRKLQKNRTLGFTMGFHLYSNEEEFSNNGAIFATQSSQSQSLNSNANSNNLNGNGSVSSSSGFSQVSFSPVFSEFGTIQLSVEFLTESPSELLHAQPSMKSVVINDFITQYGPSGPQAIVRGHSSSSSGSSDMVATSYNSASIHSSSHTSGSNPYGASVPSRPRSMTQPGRVLASTAPLVHANGSGAGVLSSGSVQSNASFVNVSHSSSTNGHTVAGSSVSAATTMNSTVLGSEGASVGAVGIPIQKPKTAHNGSQNSAQYGASAFTPASHSPPTMDQYATSANLSVSPPLGSMVPIHGSRTEQSKSFKLSFSPFRESPPTQFVPHLYPGIHQQIPSSNAVQVPQHQQHLLSQRDGVSSQKVVPHSYPYNNNPANALVPNASAVAIAAVTNAQFAANTRQRSVSDLTPASAPNMIPFAKPEQHQHQQQHPQQQQQQQQDDEDGMMFTMEGMSPQQPLPGNADAGRSVRPSAVPLRMVTDAGESDDDVVTVQSLMQNLNMHGRPSSAALDKFAHFCVQDATLAAYENYPAVHARSEFMRLQEMWKQLAF
eukprot:ANDGO_01981.mRNA.1 Autophagy-related protein 13